MAEVDYEVNQKLGSSLLEYIFSNWLSRVVM